MSTVIGVDLGGTHMQVGVVDASNTLLGRASAHTDAATGFKAVIDRIASHVREACDSAGLSLDAIDGVGLACPGAVDPASGVVLNAPNLGWDDLPAAAALAGALGRPVMLDNDVNAAALAEYTIGAGAHAGDLLAVWVGTGVGGGLILGGRVYHGTGFTAGEIGHIVADPKGGPGRRELEHLASRTAICREISARNSITETVTSSDIARMYRDSDAATIEVVGHASDLIGLAIANLATVLSLRTVVLGGGVVEAMGDVIAPLVQSSARRHIWPDELRSIEVLPTALGPDAGLFGAAMLARQRLDDA